MAKIMVVDDEPDVVYIATSILQKAGYETISAYSGEEALQKLEEVKPDLITLDIMMPNIDGFDVLKKIREKKETSSIPVIIISVKKDDSDIVRGLELGATDYFTKPYNKIVVLAKVKSILKFKRMEDKLKRYSEELEREVDEKTRALAEAHQKLKTEYYLLEKDLDLTNLQMEHDRVKVTFITGLTGIFTGVLLLSLIIMISTWNIDYLLGLFGIGAVISVFYIWISQKKMREAADKIGDIRRKSPGL